MPSVPSSTGKKTRPSREQKRDTEDRDSIIRQNTGPYRWLLSIGIGSMIALRKDRCPLALINPAVASLGLPRKRVYLLFLERGLHFEHLEELPSALVVWGECLSDHCRPIVFFRDSRRFLPVDDLKNSQSIPALTDTSKAIKAGR